MNSQSTQKLREAIRQRHGMSFVDFLRTHHWASFNILPVVAEKCGTTLDELYQLMAEETWELQKPPSLALQNHSVADLELLDALSHPETCVDTFVRDFEGSPATNPTHLTCRVEKDRLRLRIECPENHMQDVASELEETTDPEAELVWSGDTEALKDTAAWKEGPDQFRKWCQQIGDRKGSIFTGDCVVITLAAVAAGDCPAYLAPVRQVRNPLILLADPPEKPETSRIHLEGSYYYVAISPAGRIVSAFHDPWDGGVYWPCWKSGTAADVSRTDGGWALDVILPLANLEPLAVRDSVWGVDIFRHRPARGNAPAELTRSAESVFFRQTDNDLGEGRFLTTTEEFGDPGPRHAYIASELPFADRIVPRDVSSIDVRSVPDAAVDLNDQIWADAETISDLWLDQTGGEPVAKTDVRVAYDAQCLYVRFDCHDSDTANLRVVTKEEEATRYGEDNRRANYLDRREAFGLDWGDYVEVLLAPGIDDADIYHGGYYDILVNSRGDVLKRYYDPYGTYTLSEEDAWSPDLRVRIQVQDYRWATFLAIPFSSLHNVDQAAGTWRCNFKRAHGTRNASSPSCKGSEISAWSPEYGRCRLLERLGIVRFDGPLPKAGTSRPVVVPGDTDEGIERKTSPTATRDSLSGVHFPTPEKGWAVGGLGTIRHTNDGGATWRTQQADTDYALEKVFFLDERRGFAVGGRPRSQRVAITGNAGIILATTDGGENWRAVFSGKGTYLCNVFFADDRVGYTVGEYGVVLKTTDSGESWTHLANTGTNSWLLSVHFVDENHGWAAGEDGTVIATSDGGRSWQRQDAPTVRAPFGVRAAIRSVHFVDQCRGWVAGDRGTFLHTLDGGQTWQPVDLGLSYPVTDVMHFNAVRFIDGNTGILAGEPGSIVFLTTDGGRTWYREDGPNSTAVRDVCFDQQGHAWAVGELGSIARRANGTWEQVSGDMAKPRVLYGTPHGHHVNSVCWVAMADEYDIVAVFGERPVILGSHSAEMVSANKHVGCLEAGMRGTRDMADMPCGRRREPHRICHLYQNWQGIEPTERRLAAAIRSLKPEVVIAEWPILQEGYWAADVGLYARALIRAFDSAADPERFPELTRIGLPPWRAKRLFGCQPRPFGDVYQIGNRTDWTVSAKESDVVEALGMRVAEARYRGACNWIGLLDRARPRTPGPIGDYVYKSSFHLIKDTGVQFPVFGNAQVECAHTGGADG